jgi:hypothetical protein
VFERRNELNCGEMYVARNGCHKSKAINVTDVKAKDNVAMETFYVLR